MSAFWLLLFIYSNNITDLQLESGKLAAPTKNLNSKSKQLTATEGCVRREPQWIVDFLVLPYKYGDSSSHTMWDSQTESYMASYPSISKAK